MLLYDIEIVRRVEYEGKPTDMWSMGILLYALLCGCFPFRAKTYPDLYRRIARGTFTVPDELSVSVRDLLRQLLNVEPTTRITAAAALRHPWLQSQFAQAADVNKLRLESTILVSDRATDDIDDVLLKQLVEFGLTENEVVQLVMSKTHTSITTLYYLMLELLVNERRRNGNKKALPSGLNTLRKQGATITHGNNGNSAAMEVHYMTNNGVPVVINSGSSGAGQSVRPKSASAARASSSSSGSSKNGSIGHSSKNGSGDNGLHFNYQQAQQKQQMLQQQISGQNSSNGHGQHAITTGIPQRPLSATAGRRSN